MCDVILQLIQYTCPFTHTSTCLSSLYAWSYPDCWWLFLIHANLPAMFATLGYMSLDADVDLDAWWWWLLGLRCSFTQLIHQTHRSFYQTPHQLTWYKSDKLQSLSFICLKNNSQRYKKILTFHNNFFFEIKGSASVKK